MIYLSMYSILNGIRRRAKEKIKVRQNNEQILYEDCMAAGAISWRLVKFSISTGGGDKSPERKD